MDNEITSPNLNAFIRFLTRKITDYIRAEQEAQEKQEKETEKRDILQ